MMGHRAGEALKARPVFIAGTIDEFYGLNFKQVAVNLRSNRQTAPLDWLSVDERCSVC